ncbi:hypothetical protein [Pseudanabaena yagii]|uniref:Uncharacterized protein n=1 Tax=Pseudanabaena yagii GIHE-NHR1 TaxID=2722753 RepID=A0ABX1LWL8_9CYAN|nr:hypothetical protein [Pseudanabaena yagii]NMF60590.1 hypothetical protein [Pseudanabaena yagii GIHE-NHR1]
MTQLSVMELAKKGDPQAIATLINRSLESKGIHAQAELEGECLKISLQALQIPNQKAVITIIQRGMMILQVEQIKRVKILTYRSDNNYLAWQHELSLDPSPSKPLTNSQITNSANLVQDQNMNLVSNPKGVILVQKLSQIQQNLQEYQDIIVRFTDEHVGTVRCLTTLTELIQVISKPSFLFAAVASNPNLRSLLDTIAESSKTDEHGDQVITNLSILQPGQQWQKAKIRLVTKIFLEPAQDQDSPETKHQGITLDLQEAPPQSNAYPVIESRQPESPSIPQAIIYPVLETSTPEANSTSNSEIVESPLKAQEDSQLTSSKESDILDALFDDFPEPTSPISASGSSLEATTANALFDDFPDSTPIVSSPVSSSTVPEVNTDSQGSDSLFDEFMGTRSTSSNQEFEIGNLGDDLGEEFSAVQPTILQQVNDETVPTDLDDDLFNNFGFDDRSIKVDNSQVLKSDITELESDINAIKSRIPKQNLDKLLLLMDEEALNDDAKSSDNEKNESAKQLDSEKKSLSENSTNLDLGAITIERILGNMDTIALNDVSVPDPSLVTLDDLESLGF